MAGVKSGAVVLLRSGGPMMTVEKIETLGTPQRYACCHWFDRGRRHYANFALQMLDVMPLGQERVAESG